MRFIKTYFLKPSIYSVSNRIVKGTYVKPYLSPHCPWFEHHYVCFIGLHVCLFIITKDIAKTTVWKFSFFPNDFYGDSMPE